MPRLYEAFKNRFFEFANNYGQGGCSTCGYGADMQMSETDFLKMLEEIDAFAETFNKGNENASPLI